MESGAVQPRRPQASTERPDTDPARIRDMPGISWEAVALWGILIWLVIVAVSDELTF
jgi:hypothetical protein